jgi:hypothetical protein
VIRLRAQNLGAERVGGEEQCLRNRFRNSKRDSSDGINEPSERLSLTGGLLWSQISCVEGIKNIRMREVGVQIGNSG